MQYLCHSYLPADTAEETVRKIDFNKITHLNFAFSTVEKDDNGEYLPTVSEKVALGIKRTKEIIAEQHAQTKTILSIGGAGAGNFCEGCSSESARKAFAARCVELINEFGIDGIDLDWEFPGRAHLGVSFCEHCGTDYIELCREIKRAIGSSLLTAAVGSDLWGDLDYSQLNDVFDFVNVNAVITDFTVGNVIEAIDQIGDSGLAGAGGTDKGDLLTGRGVKINIV